MAAKCVACCQWPPLTAQDDIRDTTQAAFRILLKREQMEHDPELLELIDTPRVTRWTCVRRRASDR